MGGGGGGGGASMMIDYFHYFLCLKPIPSLVSHPQTWLFGAKPVRTYRGHSSAISSTFSHTQGKYHRISEIDCIYPGATIDHIPILLYISIFCGPGRNHFLLKMLFYDQL